MPLDSCFESWENEYYVGKQQKEFTVYGLFADGSGGYKWEYLKVGSKSIADFHKVEGVEQPLLYLVDEEYSELDDRVDRHYHTFTVYSAPSLKDHWEKADAADLLRWERLADPKGFETRINKMYEENAEKYSTREGRGGRRPRN